jgi:DNA repair and recombination protein RAD52
VFNQEQLQILKSEIDTKRVKTREKGNITLSYLEGHDGVVT